MSVQVMHTMEEIIQEGSLSPAHKVRRRTASDATWKNRRRIVVELDEEDSGAIYRGKSEKPIADAGFPPVACGSSDADVRRNPPVHRSSIGGGWSVTLEPGSTGRPAEWVVMEAKLTGERGDRLAVIQRTIRDTVEAHLNTTKYTTEVVQRGIELYKAINHSDGAKDPSEMLKSLGPPDPKKMLSFFLENMACAIKRVVAFANLLKGFSELDIEDRTTLFKQGSFELILTRYARLFTVDGMFTPDMTVVIPRNLVGKIPVLGELFVEQYQYADEFNRFHFTDAEIGLLCAVMICNPDRVGVGNRSAVRLLQSHYLQCFYVHLTIHHPDDCTEMYSGVMDMLLPLSAAVNESHARKISELKHRNGDLPEFPDIHNEVFP